MPIVNTKVFCFFFISVGHNDHGQIFDFNLDGFSDLKIYLHANETTEESSSVKVESENGISWKMQQHYSQTIPPLVLMFLNNGIKL